MNQFYAAAAAIRSRICVAWLTSANTENQGRNVRSRLNPSVRIVDVDVPFEQFCRNIGQGSRPVRKRRLRHLRFRVRSMLGFQDRLGHIRIVGHEPDGALAVCFKERSGKLCRPLAARTVNIVAFRPKIASARTENMAATNSELHGITFTDVR